MSISAGSAVVGDEEDSSAVADVAETEIASNVDTYFANEETVEAQEDVPVDETGVEKTSPSDVSVDGEIVNADDGVDSTEESSSIDEPTTIDVETQQVSADTSEEGEGGGIVSAVNEVLARLVEPFEAAKTAMPVVETEGEHKVEEL
ncbi:Zinc finger SWIM domain containing hypothetical protein 8-like [Phytophthora palmivora]|uniref:Uncharacterized protein n=1 Tax=Phytophthora palmivora TaxID=4796 RepID=A0A2P4YPU0_9STRA|nr:Zinc finger SWIM domain containing hypothetical protein 8-like [Phytophthora palmivora]